MRFKSSCEALSGVDLVITPNQQVPINLVGNLVVSDEAIRIRAEHHRNWLRADSVTDPQTRWTCAVSSFDRALYDQGLLFWCFFFIREGSYSRLVAVGAWDKYVDI